MSVSSIASLSASSTTSSHHQHHYHSPPSRKVIVVGSGLAGLTAATELISRDIPVHILERQAKPGGNSIKASSGINGVPTRYQIPGSDSIEAFYNDTLKSAGDRLLLEAGDVPTRERREKVITTLTYGSRAAVNWLVDEQGVDLSRVALMGGHSHARTHRGAGQTPPGASIVLTLLKKVQQNPLVTLETGSTVTEVLKSEERVVGVKVSKEVDGKSEESVIWGPVVFASGGFAGDSKGYLKKYRPDLAGFPSTNEALPGSQDLLVDVGAQLLDMDEVQVHPTGFVDSKDRSKVTKFLAAEVLRGEGGILLSQGKRFVNELQTRKVVADTITQNIDPEESEQLKQWDVSLVLDEGTYQATKSHVDFYIWKGLIKKTTIGELEDSETTLATLQEYAATVRGSTPDTLGRPSFGNWTLTDPSKDSTVYVGSVTPVVHYTMGGVVYNTNAEVLNAHGRPISGLWAAGEVTGGLHGANRLGGSSLLECVVFGRLAAESAARYVEDRERDTPIEDGNCCWESR